MYIFFASEKFIKKEQRISCSNVNKFNIEIIACHGIVNIVFLITNIHPL